MWVGITCESSMYLFNKTKPELDEGVDYGCLSKLDHYMMVGNHYIRLACYKAIVSKIWEPIVQFLIFGSSIKLAIDTYFLEYDETSQVQITSLYVDFFFNYAFIVEMMTKMIALGLIMDEGTYLRDTWN